MGTTSQSENNQGHLERVLLVCGEQMAGKSQLLRQMLGDQRLGGLGPSMGRFQSRPLSRERLIAGRFTSPHESGQTPAQFHANIAASGKCWRYNYFSAIQPRAAKNMPGVADLCDGLIRAFRPERIRVVHLAPDQWGNLRSQLTDSEIDGLRALDVEVLAIDARSRPSCPAEPGNVRILADYFDFS
jgi:hypothetical protein